MAGCLTLGSLLRAEIPADDGPLAYRPMVDEVAALWRQRKLPEVEALAERYLAKKETFADGTWKLTMLYVNLGTLKKTVDETGWKARLANVERWVRERPESVTARIVQGRLLCDYAWRARGIGFADAVTPEGWRLFEERLAQAKATLLAARAIQKGPMRDPEWFHAMMTVALGQGWAREAYEKLFAEAVAAQPGYFGFYTNKAYFLLPRWHGRPGEWQEFARQVRRTHGAEGFARICWAQGSVVGYPELFRDEGIAWAEVKAGFDEMVRRNPLSRWTLNRYARLAKDADDRATAAHLFREIGEDYYSWAWKSREMFDEYRAWALEGRATQPTLSEAARLKLPGL